jgi:hypothetical protein
MQNLDVDLVAVVTHERPLRCRREFDRATCNRVMRNAAICSRKRINRN